MADSLLKIFEKAFNRDNSLVLTRQEFNSRMHMLDRDILESIQKDLVEMGLITKERRGFILRRQL